MIKKIKNISILSPERLNFFLNKGHDCDFIVIQNTYSTID
jgi:hypothetical protein